MNSRFFLSVRRLSAVCFCTFFLCASIVSAQGLPVGGTGLVLTPSAENPMPGQTVTITATSYSFDLNTATISWKSGATTVQSGIGLTKLAVEAPQLGKKMTLDVSAVNADGNRVSGTITIGSGSVDMIIESDGYVHALFGGKIPLMYQNTFTVTAIPHLANASGQEYDPKTLVYSWKKDDGKVYQDQSGYGKQSIELDGAIIARPFVLIVTASTRDGSAQAQGAIDISYGTPHITFYVDDPLYGPLFNTAITDTVRIGSEKETSVLAVPFGFDKPADGVGKLDFTWLINSVKRAELAASETVILRAPDGTAGSSDIRLDIRNTDRILQGASSGFRATFTGSSKENTQVSF